VAVAAASSGPGLVKLRRALPIPLAALPIGDDSLSELENTHDIFFFSLAHGFLQGILVCCTDLLAPCPSRATSLLSGHASGSIRLRFDGVISRIYVLLCSVSYEDLAAGESACTACTSFSNRLCYRTCHMSSCSCARLVLETSETSQVTATASGSARLWHIPLSIQRETAWTLRMSRSRQRLLFPKAGVSLDTPSGCPVLRHQHDGESTFFRSSRL
jgi:hypothetical protein